LYLQRLAALATRHKYLPREAMVEVARELLSRPPMVIADMLAISVERAAVLPAGCAISLGAIDAVAPREIAAVPSGIREGVLRDWLDLQGFRAPKPRGDLLAGQVD
ncbi:MAG TPA: hypothetical protein VGR08_14775, partial [Thermomicrobiales bacterium]|nr:hypothetical protein [Thermomicrobiales bacterium]